jgi:hypothetical protein
MKKITRCLRAVALCIGLLTALFVLPSATFASAHSNSQVAQCSSSMLKTFATTNAKHYKPGAVVRMKVSVRNVSSRTCAITIGPTSPNIAIVNDRGDVLWNNCYANDRPGACAMYLALHSLKPKSTYSLDKTWNQRSGATDNFVARGTYWLTSSFTNVEMSNRTRFTLVQ